ncbi:50S ribosomal protein 5, chloroplastic-like [Actinidia eriantha]|uniref:50S ribosomal protein 5, chloroplastic-like n=1 Tax=Actinidia eriantha TaxID=165200 RepID=UPI0025847447|nr:50S ribosomal protein 5, chloroplastic-like [Actinidia eriantha]
MAINGTVRLSSPKASPLLVYLLIQKSNAGEMTLLALCAASPSFLSSSSSSSSSSTSTLAITSNPLSRFHKAVTTKSLEGLQINRWSSSFVLKEKSAVIVKASFETDGVGPDPDGADPPPSEVAMPVENLPLESKLELKLEQKTRMKLAKKIRLRRKRLVRKRHLRKKGRWPPSKLKKNKNV